MTAKRRKLIWNWALLIVGSALTGLGLGLFLVPNDIAAGGVTGLATVLNSWTGWPVGALALLLNVPIYTLALRGGGWRLTLRSFAGSLILSLMLDLPYPVLTTDPLLAIVYGGGITGLGVGLVLNAGASTGGSDLLGELIHRRLPALSVGWIILVIDLVVVALATLRFGLGQGLYAIIALALSSFVINLVQSGPQSARSYWIVTDQPEAMARALMQRLQRGVTAISARGMYTGDDRQILWCVVHRWEVETVKQVIREIDPTSFAMMADVHEIIGDFQTRPMKTRSDKKPVQRPENLL